MISHNNLFHDWIHIISYVYCYNFIPIYKMTSSVFFFFYKIRKIMMILVWNSKPLHFHKVVFFINLQYDACQNRYQFKITLKITKKKMNDHLSIDENKEHKQQINDALLKVGNHKLTCMAIILQYLHRLSFLYYHSTSNIIL